MNQVTGVPTSPRTATRTDSVLLAWALILMQKHSVIAVYVVFGAAGAVGSSLVERLAAQQGAKVLASDRDDSGLESLQSVQGASLHPADTEDEAAVRDVPLPSLDMLVITCGGHWPTALGFCRYVQ